MPRSQRDARPGERPAASPVAERARPDGDRRADHAEIERLASELLPALVARLSTTGLGEIEVREGPWKVRLRRPGGPPAAAAAAATRRATERPSRPQPGHEGHGHAPAALEGHRSARGAQHSVNGSGPASDDGSSTPARPPGRRPDPHRAVATSPAVGVFHPRPDARPGARVRGGDAIGAVDMLGIPQEVVAPADGVVAQILVESGDAVEYGQELVVLELMTHVPGPGPGSTR